MQINALELGLHISEQINPFYAQIMHCTGSINRS